MPTPTCFEVISDLDEAARELIGSSQYYMLGGIATSAIQHPGSVFDFSTRTLVADRDSSIPCLRDNGTLRDIDFFVLEQMSDHQARHVRDTISEAIDGRLQVSVFGLKPHREPTLARRAVEAVSAWVSDRTVDSDGNLYYELFPLVQQVPRSSYKPWRLEMPGGATVPIFNPAAHMLAYRMRSVSGVRAKDVKKVHEMTERVLHFRQFFEEIRDGDLQSWSQFAIDIGTSVWGSGGQPDSASPVASRAELQWLKAKGRMLHFAESNPTIVKYAQTAIGQLLLRGFVGSA